MAYRRRTSFTIVVTHCLTQMVCRRASNILFLILLVSLLHGCSLPRPSLFEPAAVPFLRDDGDLRSLQKALEEHQRYLLRLDPAKTFSIGGKTYGGRQLAESIDTFHALINKSLTPEQLDRRLREHFDFLQAAGRSGRPPGEMLVTGYYQPLVEGSLTPVPPFVHPLYAAPGDLIQDRLSDGTIRTGRRDRQGAFLPYWTRREIEETDVLCGNELVYLSDPFDAFLFHVQGSGKIRLRDGSVRSLRYRANNGHPYASIGKLLVDKGLMKLEEVDTSAIRNYLRNHPEEQDDILFHNERYIFFEWGDDSSTRGSLGSSLTGGRTIAIDMDALPVGAVGYLVTRQPVLGENGGIDRWTTLQRFVVPQDSGAAIEGPGRVDLFWGSGVLAETAAGAMKEPGRLYFLITK